MLSVPAISKYLFIYYFNVYVYEHFDMYLCVGFACLMPVEVRRGLQIPWKWNYG